MYVYWNCPTPMEMIYREGKSVVNAGWYRDGLLRPACTGGYGREYLQMAADSETGAVEESDQCDCTG